MKQSSTQPLHPAIAHVVLAGWTSACFAATAAAAYWWQGPVALKAASLAALVCYLPSALALSLSFWWRGAHAALRIVLVGMLLRMGIPLFVALYVKQVGSALAEAGLLYYMILFYMLTLAADTLLVVPQMHLMSPGPGRKSCTHG